MKKIVLLIVIGFLFSSDITAGDKCSCMKFHKNAVSQTEIISTLENSDLDFTPAFETESVRGVLSARYYYCDEDHGFLLVKLHDKEVFYKDVPLQTWFEFKFSKSSESYFKNEIKYNFITI